MLCWVGMEWVSHPSGLALMLLPGRLRRARLRREHARSRVVCSHHRRRRETVQLLDNVGHALRLLDGRQMGKIPPGKGRTEVGIGQTRHEQERDVQGHKHAHKTRGELLLLVSLAGKVEQNADWTRA